MRRIGAVEFTTTIAPGLRDVLSCRRINGGAPREQAPVAIIVVDAPPTGRIALPECHQGGVRSGKEADRCMQSEAWQLLRSTRPPSICHSVEALPVQEALEAIRGADGTAISSVIVISFIRPFGASGLGSRRGRGRLELNCGPGC